MAVYEVLSPCRVVFFGQELLISLKDVDQYTYTAKIMRSAQFKSYKRRMFTVTLECWRHICKQFSDKFPEGDIELGFIQPGHGFKEDKSS